MPPLFFLKSDSRYVFCYVPHYTLIMWTGLLIDPIVSIVDNKLENNVYGKRNKGVYLNG